MRSGAVLGLLTAALVVWPPAAFADDEEEDPGRGVARVSVVNGDVSVRRGDSGDWVAAAVNAPLVVEDTIATGPGSRAEVQFDYANLLRLSSNAEARLSELENRRYQVQLARGTAEWSVLRDSDADVDINTPAVSVRPAKRGRYRIHVMDDQTEVTVRSGEVEVYTPRGVERVSAGRSILVRNGAEGPEFQSVAAIPRDEFDRWSEDRDRALERTAGYRYVSPSIYGVEDLDAHGRWVYDPPYGWVWVPRTSGDWAPYRHGRWVWQDWYGWTWVGYEPWGWAPYHWGRWYHGHHGWCWYPGPRIGVHYWRPALVAFFGFGVGNVHVSFGFGRVGWVPLAPYEPFHPWYGRRYYGGYRGRYVDRSVHITNINIYNSYRNARVRHGVSGMDAGGFGRGGRHIARVSDGEIRNAGLVRGRLPMGPDRNSLRFADREARYVPRATGGERRFYSRRQAAPVNRVSFAEQRRAFEQGGDGRRAEAARGGDSGRGGTWRRVGDAGERRAEPSDRGGWRRFGEPDRRRSEGMTRENRPSERNGNWQRMGEGGSPAAEGRRSEGAARENRPAERNGNWRRFGEGGSPATEGRRSEGAARENRPAERNGNWQRIGEGGSPAPEGRRSDPERGPSDNDRTWKRFGEPRQSEAPVSRSEERSGQSERGRTWQRFGQPGAARSTEPVRRNDSTDRVRTERRYAAPERRTEWTSPRSESRSGGSWSVSGGRRETGGGFSRPSRGMESGGGGGFSRPGRSMESGASRGGHSGMSRGDGGGGGRGGRGGGGRSR